MTEMVPAGHWQFDSERSTIGFRVKKMGLYHVKGRFRRVVGTGASGDGELRAEAMIDASTVRTGIPPRDAHLRNQFLDVKHHPEIRIVADMFAPAGGGELVVGGHIEIRGTRGPLGLDAHAHVARPGQGAGELVRVHLQGTLIDTTSAFDRRNRSR